MAVNLVTSCCSIEPLWRTDPYPLNLLIWVVYCTPPLCLGQPSPTGALLLVVLQFRTSRHICRHARGSATAMSSHQCDGPRGAVMPHGWGRRRWSEGFERYGAVEELKSRMVRNLLWDNDVVGIVMKWMVDCFRRHSHHWTWYPWRRRRWQSRCRAPLFRLCWRQLVFGSWSENSARASRLRSRSTMLGAQRAAWMSSLRARKLRSWASTSQGSADADTRGPLERSTWISGAERIHWLTVRCQQLAVTWTKVTRSVLAAPLREPVALGEVTSVGYHRGWNGLRKGKSCTERFVDSGLNYDDDTLGVCDPPKESQCDLVRGSTHGAARIGWRVSDDKLSEKARLEWYRRLGFLSGYPRAIISSYTQVQFPDVWFWVEDTVWLPRAGTDAQRGALLSWDVRTPCRDKRRVLEWWGSHIPWQRFLLDKAYLLSTTGREGVADWGKHPRTGCAR